MLTTNPVEDHINEKARSLSGERIADREMYL